MLRKIAAIAVKDRPEALFDGFDDEGSCEPVFEWGDPADLYVDETYQRSITDRGLRLIKRVASGNWSWRKYKPPIVTIAPGGQRVVIDGQHTATMALSRGIRRIPWIRIDTIGGADQADAFVGQNTDRTAITAANEHKARVAAGDPAAMKVELACRNAGVILLLQQTANWPPHATMGLASIRTVIRKRGQEGAERILKILVAANVSPITADQIKAVDALVFEDEFTGLVADSKISRLLSGPEGVTLQNEALMFAATHKTPRWKGLVTKLFQAARRRAAA